MECALFEFHHDTPTLFWSSLLLNLAGHCLAILEVCLVLWLLGAYTSFVGAMIIESLTKLVNAIGSFNPGNIGTYETGNMLIAKIFGLGNAAGLALAMARRLRALFWTAVGCICLVLLTRSKKLPDLGAFDTTKSPRSPAHVPTTSSSSDVAFAVFLPAANMRFPLARVGTLPVPLRTILVAQRMNPTQIMLVADAATRQSLQQELMSTGRLPESVQWLEANADAPFQDSLRLVAASMSSRRIVLVDGSTIYNTSLIRQAAEWIHEDTALALTSADVPAGLYAMPMKTLRNLVTHRPSDATSLKELLGSIGATHSVASLNVGEDLWQRVTAESDRRVAERKLAGWLVKPTDGMYARFNRRISIPISRRLIKLPVTANMVSIFTLGVGVSSAAFFALGGYWNALLGAFLCIFASILDGCDGEVARLKLLESDFGCWLETVCDYLFYLFLFVGMTIGLWRSSGARTYLILGGLLLFGAIASFLSTGLQRHKLAAGRPEQLLTIWQTHAEGRSSNLFLYIGRHTEFIIRRCFFPYALLFFALFDIMNVAFVLSVIGANLVWPIALYSSRTFSRSGPAVPATVVSA
jgi:phosphatidylglycerophosphate synthase